MILWRSGDIEANTYIINGRKQKLSGFLLKKASLFKKMKKDEKKELTKGDGCGILRKRSRDRAENRSQERQALCKLNNTMKTRNPEIN